jgi:hypothetical protein
MTNMTWELAKRWLEHYTIENLIAARETYNNGNGVKGMPYVLKTRIRNKAVLYYVDALDE